jgi:hypothetical protein
VRRAVRALLLGAALLAFIAVGLSDLPRASADTTGFRNPTTQSAITGGDGNGYENNPADALTLDGATAEDRDSGTNGNLSCTDAGKDRHRFYNYGFTVPAGAAVNGIQVRVDVELDNATGFICAELSWDGGTTWTSAKQTVNLTSSPATYIVGGVADTWGRSWSSSDFSNTNFRVRVTDVANNTSSRFRLDWVGAQVTYTPAAPDSTGPLTSSVAAAAAGASSVTLTATVNDSTTGNSNIAAAEYFIDTLGANGAGTPMSAADGSFSSPVEDVTASVNMSTQPPGDHTLYVHGRDAAGNWGAAGSVVVTITTGGGSAVQATITLIAGTLSVDTYPIAFPGVTLDGFDQIVDTSPASWRAIDARGISAGWNLTLTSGDFSAPGGTIPVANFKVQQLQSRIAVNSGNTAPVTQAGSYQALSNTIPLKLISAAAGTGMGSYDFTPDFRLIVPASTTPGEYRASLVVSVNSGP